MTTHTLSTPSATADARMTDFRHSAARLFPLVDDTSELTLVCRRSDYSASVIARAAEDCDTHLLNLNITADPSPDGNPESVVVEIRIGRRDPSAVARSLSRYGYDVVDTRSPMADMAGERALGRIRELIRHLEV